MQMIIGSLFSSGTRRLSLLDLSLSSLVNLRNGRRSIHLSHGDGLRLQLEERGGRLLESLPESVQRPRPHRGHHPEGGARWEALLPPPPVENQSRAQVGSTLLQQFAGQDC